MAIFPFRMTFRFTIWRKKYSCKNRWKNFQAREISIEGASSWRIQCHNWGHKHKAKWNNTIYYRNFEFRNTKNNLIQKWQCQRKTTEVLSTATKGKVSKSFSKSEREWSLNGITNQIARSRVQKWCRRLRKKMRLTIKTWQMMSLVTKIGQRHFCW